MSLSGMPISVRFVCKQQLKLVRKHDVDNSLQHNIDEMRGVR